MLNERQLGKSIKYLAMTAESIKHYKNFKNDEEAYDYVLNTLPIDFPIDELRTTCPPTGSDSLRNKVLSKMTKLATYKIATNKLVNVDDMDREELLEIVAEIVSHVPCASTDFATYIPNILLERNIISHDDYNEMINQ